MTEAVSIIVVTWNERDNLLRCLASLERQTWPREGVEIVVVDDGSEDGTARAVEREFPGAVLVVKENSGPDNSRNFGIGRATGGIVAFIDADCTAPPNWLERLAAGLEEHGTPVIGGRIPHPGGFWARMTGLSDFGEFQGLKPREVSNIPTCNMGLRRELLQQFRFDEEARIGGDVLFSQQLRESGIRLLYDPRIIVHHHPEATRKAFFERARRYGAGFVQIRRQAPGLKHGWLVRMGTPGVIVATLSRGLLDWARLIRYGHAAGVRWYEYPAAAAVLLLKRLASLGPAVKASRTGEP
jgi:glycosyltransferase involved in cell wall biosynthesis